MGGLTTADALTYIGAVKNVFQDQKEKYETFLEVLMDFRAQRVDTDSVIARVKDLFEGYNDLLSGFNTFLPKSYKITLQPEDEKLKKKKVCRNGRPLTTSDAMAYLKAVKNVFQDEKEKYETFLEVLMDFRAQRIDTNGVIVRVKDLFKGYNDLLSGFNTFLPKRYKITLHPKDEKLKKTRFRRSYRFERSYRFLRSYRYLRGYRFCQQIKARFGDDGLQ